MAQLAEKNPAWSPDLTAFPYSDSGIRICPSPMHRWALLFVLRRAVHRDASSGHQQEQSPQWEEKGSLLQFQQKC